MDTLQQSSSSDGVKIPRVRSVAYPSFTIQHCIELTSDIHKFFGNSVYVSREQISIKTEISDSHLQTQLSSCVQYGLLELKPKEGYKPTALFTKIYRPLPNENIRDSKLEAFNCPELYKKIISECNNQIHTIDSLSTILFRNYKVSEGAAPFAAKIFLENAKELLLIDEQNLLNIDGAKIDDALEVLEDIGSKGEPERLKEVKFLPPHDESSATKPKLYNHPPIPIFYDDGTIGELYLPNGFEKSKIEKTVKVLTAYL